MHVVKCSLLDLLFMFCDLVSVPASVLNYTHLFNEQTLCSLCIEYIHVFKCLCTLMVKFMFKKADQGSKLSGSPERTECVSTPRVSI